jgi:hypothetical protein
MSASFKLGQSPVQLGLQGLKLLFEKRHAGLQGRVGYTAFQQVLALLV